MPAMHQQPNDILPGTRVPFAFHYLDRSFMVEIYADDGEGVPSQFRMGQGRGKPIILVVIPIQQVVEEHAELDLPWGHVLTGGPESVEGILRKLHVVLPQLEGLPHHLLLIGNDPEPPHQEGARDLEERALTQLYLRLARHLRHTLQASKRFAIQRQAVLPIVLVPSFAVPSNLADPWGTSVAPGDLSHIGLPWGGDVTGLGVKLLFQENGGLVRELRRTTIYSIHDRDLDVQNGTSLNLHPHPVPQIAAE